jgi:hypothetical protein
MDDLKKELKGMLNKIILKLRDILSELEIQKVSAAKYHEEEAKHRNSPAPVNILPTHIVVDSFPTTTQDEIAYRKEKRAREGEHSFIEKLALVVLAIYTLFTGYQVYLTRQAVENNKETLRQMKDARDDNAISTGDTLIRMQAQTRAMGDQVTQLQALVRTSQQSLGVAEKHFRLSERPWIEVGTNIGIEHPNYIGATPLSPILPDIPLFRNFPHNLVATTKNYGRNAALRAYVEFNEKWVELPRETTPGFQNVTIPVHERCQTGFPFSDTANQAEFPTGVYMNRTVDIIIGDEMIDKFLSLRSAVFAYGCVRYKDSSKLDTKEFYQTDFCNYLWLGDTPHKWEPCPKGNGVR